MTNKKRRALKAIIAALAMKKIRSTKMKRSVWTKPWLSRRQELGICNNLLKELEVEDSSSFQNFLRCNPQQFLNLLHLVQHDISKTYTHLRACITAEERLAVTLRYLATGESFRSLSYSFRIAHSTISTIIPEVCEALYQALKDTHLKVPSSVSEWESIATDFADKWNFPNCIGSLDGKHVVMQAPTNSGSYYYNYKNTHSIVLMAAVDANYRFTYIDVGTNGRTSDGGTFQNCSLNHALEAHALNIPAPVPLPNKDKSLPFVFVADEAFPLKECIMRPYPQRGGLTDEQRIFNYRLSRARRVVGNAFGILSNRFRVLRAPILLAPEKATSVVMACCALHNFLRPESFNNINGSDQEEAENATEMSTISRAFGSNHSSNKAREVRESFKEYFCTDGQVPWQFKVLP